MPMSEPKPLHLGILQTDSVLEDLQPRFGDYPSMFEGLFRAADPSMRFSTYNVQRALPASLDCDAYLITGCKLSVYDDLPWIAELADFVRMAMAAQKKILGICFGHQLMAHFFGGAVGPAAAGWAVGVQTSNLVQTPEWMTSVGQAPQQLHLVSSHKDQVLELPEGAEVFASSDFCPVSGFTMGERVLTIQGHPELSAEYSRALMGVRRQLLGEQVYQAGVDSLRQDTDEALFTRWMVAFIQSNADELAVAPSARAHSG
ncbi:MAG: GMP synthase [Proteobacteria bacterium]|nr:GMP synthase [Pseudomonadota bacterium]